MMAALCGPARRGVAAMLAAAIALLLLAGPSHAVRPDEVLDDPVLEERARELSAELRCLVCQNQSIDESDAPLARDLRLLVRERLVEGDSDEEVREYLVARYGEFVLLNPRFGVHTLALWAVAPLLLLLGGIALWVARRRSRTAPETPARLSEAEQAEIERILRE